MKSNMKFKIRSCFLAVLFLMVLFSSSLHAISFISAPLDSSSDYFVYYGSFDANRVLQAQYYDLIVLDTRYITADQIYDIRDGFDDLSGTNDDVMVIGYLSIGEHDVDVPIAGDGTGPVYFDTTTNSVVYQNNGYASFYVDDADKNGIPDIDPIWGSYYVNAGDTAWWSLNAATADSIMYDFECDGLFLDLVDVAGPASYGLPYGWTGEGMVDYVSFLNESYNYGSDTAYILANRGAFYFDSSVAHYDFVDTYRENIHGWMMESYYATWDWNQSIGIYNTGHPILRDYFAPLINAQANQVDGFDVFILDYLNLNQSNYAAMLDTIVKVSERDQGWLTAVSTILLDDMRYDTYHHHLSDNNSPTWKDTVGAVSAEWGNGDTVVVYWNAAVDQTPPVKYHIYIDTEDINYAAGPTYSNVTPINAGGTITVDGDTADWDDISPLLSSTGSIKKIRAASNASTLYILVQGSDINNITFPDILIDVDNDTSTGYTNALWAENGCDRLIENQYLYSHSGSGWSWSSPPVTLSQYVKNNTTIEAAVPLSSLGIAAGDTIRIGFMGDFSVSKILPTFSGTMPSFITGGTMTDYMFKIGDLDTDESYNITVRASDSATPEHLDRNTKLIETGFIAKRAPAQTAKQQGELKISNTAFPNPFNPSVTFSVQFSDNVTDDFQVKIFDITGSLVHQETITSADKAGFMYSWNAGNLSSGMYLYRITGLKTHLSTNGKILFLK